MRCIKVEGCRLQRGAVVRQDAKFKLKCQSQKNIEPEREAAVYDYKTFTSINPITFTQYNLSHVRQAILAAPIPLLRLLCAPRVRQYLFPKQCAIGSSTRRAIHFLHTMASVQAFEADTGPAQPVNTIDATPQAGQTINHEGKEYTTIQEGLAYILVPKGTPTSMDPKLSKEDTQKQQVFYNPIQQFNRDLSVLAIKTFGEDLVERRRQKREQQRKKADRQAERKRRKLEAGSNHDENTVIEEAGVQPSHGQKRKLDSTVDIEGDIEMQDTGGLSSKKQKTVEDTGSNLVPDPTMDTEGDGPLGKANVSCEWKPPFTILDALSATGLRALRYAQEIPSSTSITANDMSTKATESIALNIKHNKLEDKIQANTGNAIVHMYSFSDKKGYDVIDLDPYGTAAPFIDAAIQAINDDGLLCVTCTDSAIFASHGYLEKTYSQYGGLPLKGDPCHEGGLRLILHAIASSAARYGMAIEPLLSLSIDYYIRVFVRVRKSASDVKLLAGKTMIVYHCQTGCGSWSTQFLARNKPTQNRDGTSSYKHSFAQGPAANQVCEHCGTKTHVSYMYMCLLRC